MVSLRLLEGIPSLRDKRVFGAVWNAMQQGRERLGGRLVHFSAQSNHLHTIVETVDEKALTRFVAGLKIRIARTINRLLGRRSRVFSDRYHSKVLHTPRETRNAIAYVLNNDLRHTVRRDGAFDLYGSAPLFDGWTEGRVCWPKPLVGPPPVHAGLELAIDHGLAARRSH